jgi:hypothetical protein
MLNARADRFTTITKLQLLVTGATSFQIHVTNAGRDKGKVMK